MNNKQDNGTSKTSFILLVGYLLSSIFAGLIFSGLAMKAKSNGGTGIGWGILSLLCIAFLDILATPFILLLVHPLIPSGIISE